MDPHKFDELIRQLSQTLSRRSLVAGPLATSLLAAATSAGLGDDALAKKDKKARGQGKQKDKRDGAKKAGKRDGKKKREGAGGEGHARKVADEAVVGCIPTGSVCRFRRRRRRRRGRNLCFRCCSGRSAAGVCTGFVS